jgi:hypothetical protein
MQSIPFRTQTALLAPRRRTLVFRLPRQKRTPLACVRVPLLIRDRNLLPGFQLIEQIYLNGDTALPSARAEEILLSKALEAYDSASNGNKTRGGIKKANDM